jgi:hypothetical protein
MTCPDMDPWEPKGLEPKRGSQVVRAADQLAENRGREEHQGDYPHRSFIVDRAAGGKEDCCQEEHHGTYSNAAPESRACGPSRRAFHSRAGRKRCESPKMPAAEEAEGTEDHGFQEEHPKLCRDAAWEAGPAENHVAEGPVTGQERRMRSRRGQGRRSSRPRASGSTRGDVAAAPRMWCLWPGG